MSLITTKINNKEGRIGRSGFFLKSLLVILFSIVIIFARINLLITTILLAAVVLIPYVNLLYSRSHDINQKGNIEVYTFIVLLLLMLSQQFIIGDGIIAAVLGVLSLINFILVIVIYIYLIFKKGVIGKNQYGEDPLDKKTTKSK